jgi:ketosteroid isomerase-like protein
MSQENVEVARRWMGTFADDPERFASTLHPELQWFPFEDNHAPSYGIDGGMRIRNHWMDAWDEMRIDVEGMAASGENVVASVHAMGRGRVSGVEVDVRLHLHFKVQDGKIIYIFEHEDKAAALRAAGLSDRDSQEGATGLSEG